MPASNFPLGGWMSGIWTQNWTRFGWRPLRHWEVGDNFGWMSPLSGVGGPCPLLIYTLAFASQLRKAREISVRIAEQCCVLLVASALSSCRGGLDWPAEHPSSSAYLGGLQRTLGRRRCLLSCRNKGFPAPVVFNSKLSCKVLMWWKKKGIPKSSWIYLLPTYQGALVWVGIFLTLCRKKQCRETETCMCYGDEDSSCGLLGCGIP
jgi:hypothetical protein